MKNIRVISFLGMMLTLASCSSVKLAVYDSQKRQDLAIESKAALKNSPAVKERTAKAALSHGASKYIGSPYRYGSCDASKGFDCSGLVYTVAKSQDLDLPRSSSLMATTGAHIPWKKAEPGDLIFFGERNRINHVGIVEKNKGDEMWVIHSTTSDGVVLQNVLNSAYWKERILFAVDIISPSQTKS
jgi:cell wall-associated NlpC family hydrolase